MFITTPANVLSMSSARHDLVDGTHIVLKMQQDSAVFYLENHTARPSDENYREVISFLEETAELRLSMDEIKALLDLYPRSRIKVAVYDGVGDTDVRDAVSFAISHFLLGCPWPTYGDNVDANAFSALLKKQAAAIGFGIPV